MLELLEIFLFFSYRNSNKKVRNFSIFSYRNVRNYSIFSYINIRNVSYIEML